MNDEGVIFPTELVELAAERGRTRRQKRLIRQAFADVGVVRRDSDRRDFAYVLDQIARGERKPEILAQAILDKARVRPVFYYAFGEK